MMSQTPLYRRRTSVNFEQRAEWRTGGVWAESNPYEHHRESCYLEEIMNIPRRGLKTLTVKSKCRAGTPYLT